MRPIIFIPRTTLKSDADKLEAEGFMVIPWLRDDAQAIFPPNEESQRIRWRDLMEKSRRREATDNNG